MEKDLYFPDSKFLKMAFGNANKNKGIKALCMGHLHYAWNDKDYYNELLAVVTIGLHEFDFSQIKPFLTLLQYMLRNPGGEASENRFERTIIAFLDVIENN